MSNLRVLFFTCVLLSQGTAALLAQQPATSDSVRWVRVYTQSPRHKNVEGQLIAENDSFLILSVRRLDSLSIPKNTIRRVQYIKHFENGHAHRYFAGTSGHGLRRGEIAYDNGMLFFSQLSYGLNNHVTIGAGTSLGFVFGGAWGQWIAPKVSLPLKKDQITLTLGGIIGQSVGSSYEPDNYSFNATYGQLTFGSREAHLSIGGGLVTSRGQWRRPVLSFASALRASRGVSFLIEGYMFEDYGDRITLLGPGIRLMGRRVALDISGVWYKDEYYGQIVPWASLHLLFGKIKQ